MQTYTQCRLGKGKKQQVAWIPSEFAKKHKSLKIKDEDGWRVIGVGATVKENYLRRYERSYLDQRQASDI